MVDDCGSTHTHTHKHTHTHTHTHSHTHIHTQEHTKRSMHLTTTLVGRIHTGVENVDKRKALSCPVSGGYYPQPKILTLNPARP